MPRFLVHGYYTDESQVVIDVVDAESDEAAEAAVVHARGGEHSGYTPDGAESLEDAVANLMNLKVRSEADVARDLAAIAAEYAHYHEETER